MTFEIVSTRLVAFTIPEAIEAALAPLLHTAVGGSFRGTGFGAEWWPHPKLWADVEARVNVEVRRWADQNGRRVTVRQAGEDDQPREGVFVVECDDGVNPLRSLIVYAITWNPQTRGLELQPVTHAAREEAELYAARKALRTPK